MTVVSLAISRERQQASHLRLLQTVWADRDYPQVEAYGREGQDGDSWSRGYFAYRRHYMLSALCIADLSTVHIRNNPFGNNDIWPLLEKDIRIGPWTWAGHADLTAWLLVHGNMDSHYHATNFPEYTPRAFASSIRIANIDKDAIRSGFGHHGGRAMDFGPAIKVPLHGPATSNVVVTAGQVAKVMLTAAEGVPPYTYRLPADAPEWMTLAGAIVTLAPPMKLDTQGGETAAVIMDDEAQEVVAAIVWAVEAAPPTN